MFSKEMKKVNKERSQGDLCSRKAWTRPIGLAEQDDRNEEGEQGLQRTRNAHLRKVSKDSSTSKEETEEEELSAKKDENNCSMSYLQQVWSEKGSKDIH